MKWKGSSEFEFHEYASASFQKITPLLKRYICKVTNGKDRVMRKMWSQYSENKIQYNTMSRTFIGRVNSGKC